MSDHTIDISKLPAALTLSSESELIELGEKLASFSPPAGRPRVFELIGDVGAGKTTLTKGIARGLGVTEPLTSPSFTISKSYATARGTLAHYDFYRLEDPGIMQDDLAENLADPQSTVVIEWGNSITDLLPKERTVVKITTQEDGTRRVEITKL